VVAGDDLQTPPGAHEPTPAARAVSLGTRSVATQRGPAPPDCRRGDGPAPDRRYRPGIDTSPDDRGTTDRTAPSAPVGRNGSAVRVAVLADTHLRTGIDGLPPRAGAELEAADVVLHAGDVVDHALLDELPVPWHAVLGNNDHGLVGALPDRLELELGGVQVAMVHDSGARAGRERRMRRWFPTADVVVFGHSHDPVDAEEDGQRLFNPGSAVQRRRQPHRTMGVLVLGAGAVLEHRIVVVDD
jgi:putative phosphoesterase